MVKTLWQIGDEQIKVNTRRGLPDAPLEDITTKEIAQCSMDGEQTRVKGVSR